MPDKILWGADSTPGDTGNIEYKYATCEMLNQRNSMVKETQEISNTSRLSVICLNGGIIFLKRIKYY